MVAVPEFKGTSYSDMIESVRSECPALEDVVFISEGSWRSPVAAGRSKGHWDSRRDR